MKGREKGSFLWIVFISTPGSFHILNFSSNSSKDIFLTSLSVHFSSPWGSNLRVLLLQYVNEMTRGFRKVILTSLHFGTFILGFMWKGILTNETVA